MTLHALFIVLVVGYAAFAGAALVAGVYALTGLWDYARAHRGELHPFGAAMWLAVALAFATFSWVFSGEMLAVLAVLRS